MTQDKPMIGILLMFGFCILAPLGDGIAKLLSASLPLLGLLAARFVIQAVILLPIERVGRVWASEACFCHCGICPWPMLSRLPL
jgi:hypothetical protein